jgi:phenylalanyl-tRNA synthetase beta chain
MRVPLSWLREFVPVDAGAEEIAERLTLSGLHVDEIERPGSAIEGVVVGEVLDVRDIPGAQNLVLVTATTGDGPREIVCGVRNFERGDRVPVALPGAKLPGGLEIGERRIMGQVSSGMLCSPRELEISDDHGGILVLDREAPLGEDIRTALGLDDPVLVIDVTPNRPDALSIVGVAREVSALYALPLSVPSVELQESSEDAEQMASVRIDDPRGCPRYLARVITGVRVGPSPWWIKRRLLAAGMRPIANVVDVTNYVLLERGHPLHAFDLSTLDGRTIVVRRPKKGERLTTLDGVERKLERDDVAICDARRPVAVAGIMGGAGTDVSERTSEILLESAYFDSRRVSRTARRLGSRTEASVRFERGADVSAVPIAAARAAELLARLAGGVVARGAIDVYPRPAKTRRLRLRPARANALLGTEVAPGEMAEHLRAIGCSVTATSRTMIRVEPPTFRPDLVAEEDLVEEIARLRGYGRIPSTLPFGGEGGGLSRAQGLRRLARRVLLGAGLSEAQSLTLIPPRIPDVLALPPSHPWRDVVRVANPLSEEESVLRPSLLPGLLMAASRNIAHGNTSVALFEIGTVFRPASGELPNERVEAAWVMCGPAPLGWHEPERSYDFYDGKGVLEALLSALGVDGWSVHPPTHALPPWHGGRTAEVLLGGREVGLVGELQPSSLRDLGLTGRVVSGSIDLDASIRAAAEFRPQTISRFPAVRRDLAVVVDEGAASADVIAVVREAGGSLLESAELFDVYRGAPVAEGNISLAYALAFRDPGRTLTDAEVEPAFARIVEALQGRGWSIRA